VPAPGRRVAIGLATVLVLFGLVGTPASAAPAAAPASASFTNPTRILKGSVPPGETDQVPATPYPSNIAVSGLSGTVSDVNLTLNGFDCSRADFPDGAYPEDMDVLLVAPSGTNAIIMSDDGGDNLQPRPVGPLDLTIDDAADAPLPADDYLFPGSYQPFNDDDDLYETSNVDRWFAPAPTPSGATALSTFNGTDPNGTWSLYVVYDYISYVNNGERLTTGCEINSGWTLDLTTGTAAGAPGPPRQVVATPTTDGSGRVTVSWSPPATDGGSPITGYTVSATPGGQTCSTTGALTCTFTGLTNGTSYRFNVVAINSAGPGNPSALSLAVAPVGPASAPTGVTATAGNGQATVTWNPPSTTNGAGVANYVVTGDPGGFCQTNGQRTCTITGLTNGTTYTFTVVANNGNGSSPPSAPSNPVVPAGPPGAPTGVAASSGNGQATVTWTAPAANGSPITGYTVTGAPGGQTCSTTGGLSCTVTGLTNGTSYTFTVVATNGAGSSSPSAPSSAVVPAGPPGAPTGVAATAGNGQATVTWTAPAANGSPITGYTVTGAPGGQTCSTTGGLSCTVTGLTNGTSYTFTVVAANRAGSSPASAPSAAIFLSPGYRLVAADGGVFAFGNARFLGSTGGRALNSPVVAMADTPSRNGYWLVAADGGIFAFGDAVFRGSLGSAPLAKPIVGMEGTPSGNGYWLVASDGGIFAFGDAVFRGSLGSAPLAKPIVGMERTPSGNGYWLVAADGGIFAFGDAGFQGSLGATRLTKPIVGMARTTSGNGYWLVAADGGIFAFGDALFRGSLGGTPLNRPIVGMETSPSGKGYWLVGSDGGIFAFGDAEFAGSTGGAPLVRPIVAMAA
jgi:hypothetical protein